MRTMAQASDSLSPKRAAELERQHRHAAIVLALQSATRTIKTQLQAEGIKVNHVSVRDIRIQAEAYLDVHRTRLIAEATAIVEQWTAEGFFGKRAQRAWCSQLASDAQPPELCFDNTISVQMLGAEGS
jgi:hypothetical protein